jgi:AmmeMemoRadiSam system protein A
MIIPCDDAALARTHGRDLLRIAARAVRHGIDNAQPLRLALADYPEPLRVKRATFVTLEHDGELQGCIGTIEPHDALAASVAHYAHLAAFQDARFDPVQETHWPGLAAEVSILSPRAPLPAPSEAAALAVLRPGIDGLVFAAGPYRSVFLPKVWEDLPEPKRFLGFLKRKAGLPEDYWSAEVKLERFTCALVPSQPLRQLLDGF